MLRAAIYARYSSDNRSEASIEDQIEICRRYAAQQGFSVEAVFDDRALSGSSTNRPGYKALLEQARRGGFDVNHRRGARPPDAQARRDRPHP